MRHFALAALFFCLASGAAQAQTTEPTSQDLSGEALRLVNQDRVQNNLAELTPGQDLQEAASAHAQDMLERNYYDHVSPSGADVQDRFIDAGGSRWELVAENIARCQGCATDLQTLSQLQQGWMESPGHRRNILSQGVARFGFGIASGNGTLYAVQNFAGPGTPRGLEPGQTAEPVTDAAAADILLESVNLERQQAGAEALALSEPLTNAAHELLPASDDAQFAIDTDSNPYDALPEDARTGWSRLSLASSACGGCGAEQTQADVQSFASQWLEAPNTRRSLLAEDLTHIGFAMAANGTGKKVAVMLTGTAR